MNSAAYWTLIGFGVAALALGVTWLARSRGRTLTFGLSASLVVGFLGCGIAGSKEVRTAQGYLSIQYVRPEHTGALLRQGAGFAVPAGLTCFLFAATRLSRSRHHTQRHNEICCRCGYCIKGLDDARCPECGEPFSKRLFRDYHIKDSDDTQI